MGVENSSMQFLDYKIESIDYKMNQYFDFGTAHNIKMEQKIGLEIQIISNDEFVVKLITHIYGENKKNSPFELNISLLGCFYLEKWQETEEKQNMVKFNAPTILFPYLRSIITNITATANITPYILPTFNMYDLFCENEK